MLFKAGSLPSPIVLNCCRQEADDLARLTLGCCKVIQFYTPFVTNMLARYWIWVSPYNLGKCLQQRRRRPPPSLV